MSPNNGKVLTPLLKGLGQPPDVLDEYRAELGYLGPALRAAVTKARTQPQPCLTTFTAVTTATPGSLQPPRPTPTLVQPGNAQQGRTFVVGGTSANRPVVNPNTGCKYVIVTSRPPTPSQTLQTSGTSSNPGATVVKFVTSAQAVTTQKVVTASAGSSQMMKSVVVSMTNSGQTSSNSSTLVTQASSNLGVKSVFVTQSQQSVKLESSMSQDDHHLS